jgi:mRNA interferase MazF
MILNQRDIYLIKFGPGTGHEYRRTRPGIILMDNKILQTANMVTCVPLTSNLGNRIRDDILIAKDTGNKLPTDSLVKMHHITCCDKSRLIKYIGRIGSTDWQKIVSGLKNIFGI